MATRAILTPYSAEFPTSSYPKLLTIGTGMRPCLAFNDTSPESAYWTIVAPQGLTGTMTAVLSYVMATANANSIEFEVAVQAVSDGDSTDLLTTNTFDTVNSSGPITVPATAGFIDQVSVTLTNQNSVAAGDLLRISVSRDADDATNDTATGDLYLLSVELRDTA